MNFWIWKIILDILDKEEVVYSVTIYSIEVTVDHRMLCCMFGKKLRKEEVVKYQSQVSHSLSLMFRLLGPITEEYYYIS